jgi:hypothetical protein
MLDRLHVHIRLEWEDPRTYLNCYFCERAIRDLLCRTVEHPYNGRYFRDFYNSKYFTGLYDGAALKLPYTLVSSTPDERIYQQAYPYLGIGFGCPDQHLYDLCGLIESHFRFANHIAKFRLTP